jgi:hypothetical protein
VNAATLCRHGRMWECYQDEQMLARQNVFVMPSHERVPPAFVASRHSRAERHVPERYRPGQFQCLQQLCRQIQPSIRPPKDPRTNDSQALAERQPLALHHRRGAAIGSSSMSFFRAHPRMPTSRCESLSDIGAIPDNTYPGALRLYLRQGCEARSWTACLYERYPQEHRDRSYARPCAAFAQRG